VQPEYAFVDIEGQDDEALRLGVAWLVRRAQETLHSEAAIFVPTLPQVEHLSGALGAERARRLERERSVRIDGVTVKLITAKSRQSWSGPLLAVWADDGQLARFDRGNLPGLGVIPWLRGDITDFKARCQPLDLRSQKQAGGEDPVTNPVVAVALTALTNLVNLSSGIGHPSDRPKAIWAFKLLRDAGESFTPQEIRDGASHRGWRSTHAAELAQVADGVLKGRALRGGTNPLRPDVVERWRDEARATT